MKCLTTKMFFLMSFFAMNYRPCSPVGYKSFDPVQSHKFKVVKQH